MTCCEYDSVYVAGMDSREMYARSALLLLLLLSLSSVAFAAEKPNIIFMLMDDVSSAHVTLLDIFIFRSKTSAIGVISILACCSLVSYIN